MADLILDKVKMNVVSTAPNGVVNESTIFNFSQSETFISADYSGGKISKGYLVGTLSKNKLVFSYCQLQDDGKMDNGQSECELIVGEDGKIRLIENFKFASRNGETGTNVFREL